MQFNLVRRGESANLTAFVQGEMYPADEAHPSFDALVEAAINDDEETFLSLFDTSSGLAERFESLSDRVTVANSRVYVDQTEVSDAYGDQIIKFVEQGVDDWKPLVAFLEKVYSNTSEGIRENLSRWLKSEEFTILPNGNILGYRGLNSDYTSKHAGPGIVNGKRVNGHLDNSVGNVLEIDADSVDSNPSVGCSVGLHVGTYEYASSWAGYNGVVVSVEVNPVHVRAVPYECNSSKMRVSKYVVKETVLAKKNDVVYSGYDAYDDHEYDEYDDDEGTYTY